MSRVLAVLLIFLLLTNKIYAQESRENFKFAKFKYDKGLYQESMGFLNKALLDDSLYISAYYLRAETNYHLGQYYNAILDINRIFKIEKSPTSSAAEYYLTRGKSFLALEDFSNAAIDFDKSIAISRNDGNAYFYKAKLNLANLNYNEAIAEIDHAIQANADEPEYYALRSEIKIQHSKPAPNSEAYKSVLGDINVAIALAPDNHEYYLIRSNFLKTMGEVNAALDDYNKVISLSPKKEEAYTNRGMIKMNNYEYQSAALDFTKSIIINPNDERNYRFRGLCYNNLNDYNEAFKDFSKSIDMLTIELNDESEKKQIKNTLAETYVLRGHCLNLMGNNAQACRDFLMAHNLGIKKGLNYYRKYCGIY